MKKLLRIFFTLKDLRWQQWWFRAWHPVKRLFYKTPLLPATALDAAQQFPVHAFFMLPPPYPARPSANCFGFLNREKTFASKIDWNFQGYGLLWAFHLNYLDCLRDETLSAAGRLQVLQVMAAAKKELKIGLASYPSSVRLINAIRFLGNSKKPEAVVSLLWEDACRIAAFPERHLLANHFLENAFALLHAAHFFKEKRFFEQSRRWLLRQLEEQILPDGGHFERSPAYHLHVLMRVLQGLELIRISGSFPDERLSQLLSEKAALLLGWTNAMAENGRLPHFGDSNDEMAPALPRLWKYARHLNLTGKPVVLKESGYRILKDAAWTIWQNAGGAGPAYQPGHAHADPLSFVAFLHGAPFLTSAGVSTYENNKQRQWERSTAAHHTPVVGGQNASDVWSAFRMGRKAAVLLLRDDACEIAARHTGYKKQGAGVESTLKQAKSNIELCFSIRNYGKAGKKAVLNLYCDPGRKISLENNVVIAAGMPVMEIQPKLEISLSRYAHATGFYRTLEGSRITIAFYDQIKLVFYNPQLIPPTPPPPIHAHGY